MLGALLPTLVVLAIALGYILLNYATGALEPGIDAWRRAFGCVLLVALPLALPVAGWDAWPGIGVAWPWAHDHLEVHVDDWALGAALLLAAAAAIAAVVRVAFELPVFPLSWRRRVLALFRLGFVGGLIALGVGFAVERWQQEPSPALDCDPADPCLGTDWASVADERKGLILFACLVAAALLAAIVVELLIPAWERFLGWRRVRRSAPHTRPDE